MIVTVTLNPAVDEEFVVSDFRPGGWLRSQQADRTPGGKGINVSIMLHQIGYESTAMGYLAGFNGAYILDFLRREQITTSFVHVPGETRTNVYIIDENGNVGTGLSEPGPDVSEDAQVRFMRMYTRMLQRARVVVIGGSLPPGVETGIYAELIRKAQSLGIPTIIDSAGEPLLEALDAEPTIAKIDHRFMSRMHGVPLNSLDNIIDVVSRLRERGIQWVIASYHVFGNVFSCPDGIFLSMSDRRTAVSLFASSDALIAGMIAAREEKMSSLDTIRFAMACAWETTTHFEKGIFGRAAVADIMRKVEIEKLC